MPTTWTNQWCTRASDTNHGTRYNMIKIKSFFFVFTWQYKIFVSEYITITTVDQKNSCLHRYRPSSTDYYYRISMHLRKKNINFTKSRDIHIYQSDVKEIKPFSNFVPIKKVCALAIHTASFSLKASSLLKKWNKCLPKNEFYLIRM